MKTFKLLFIAIFMVTLLLPSCKKDSATDPSDLSGTQWKSNKQEYTDVDFSILKFTSKTVFEWWDNIILSLDGGPLGPEKQFLGSYSINGNTITLKFGSNETFIGAINGNTIVFTDAGETITFTKQ